MTYDYEELFDCILTVSRSSDPTPRRMQKLLGYCSGQIPHSDWARLAKVDFDADTEKVDSWLSRALSSLEENTAGLWFGLNNPVRSEGVTADIYVAGAREFSSVAIDWASDSLLFESAEYLESEVLHTIYNLAYVPGGIGNEAEYPLCLAYGLMVAQAMLERLDVGLVPKLSGAAVGFDSGDFVFLGTVQNRMFNLDLQAG